MPSQSVYLGTESRRLSADEERDLARRRDAGDRSALDVMVRHNLRLAAMLAGKAAEKYDLDRSDAQWAAIEGVLTAATLFDPDKGRLGTFVGTWVTSSIQKYRFDFKSPVHLPLLRAKAVATAKPAGPRQDEYNRKLLAAMRPAAAVDDLFTLDEPRADPDLDERRGRELMSAIESLPEPMRLVLALRFPFEPGRERVELAEIARDLGVTVSAVSEIQRQAALRLRRALAPLPCFAA